MSVFGEKTTLEILANQQGSLRSFFFDIPRVHFLMKREREERERERQTDRQRQRETETETETKTESLLTQGTGLCLLISAVFPHFATLLPFPPVEPSSYFKKRQLTLLLQYAT